MSSGPPAKRLKQLALKFDVVPRRPLQQQEAGQNDTHPGATVSPFPLLLRCIAILILGQVRQLVRLRLHVNAVKNIMIAGTNNSYLNLKEYTSVS